MSEGAKFMTVFALFWGTYIAGAFLTAAYYDQHVWEPCVAEWHSKPELDRGVFSGCGATPVVGMFWPAYWAWRGARVVTR